MTAAWFELSPCGRYFIMRFSIVQGSDDAIGRVWMSRAIALAAENVRSGEGGPFGAVVVCDGAVVGEAANRVVAMLDPSAHAEVLAIRAACRSLGRFELRGCTIYSSCEPCPMCLAAIYWARMDRIVYGATAEDAAAAGFDDARFYEELRRAASERTVPCTLLLRDEAGACFAAWREASARQPY